MEGGAFTSIPGGEPGVAFGSPRRRRGNGQPTDTAGASHLGDGRKAGGLIPTLSLGKGRGRYRIRDP